VAGLVHVPGSSSSSSKYGHTDNKEQATVLPLLQVLAHIYDVALPAVASALTAASPLAATDSASSLTKNFAGRVSNRLLQLICQLVKATYLEPSGTAETAASTCGVNQGASSNTTLPASSSKALSSIGSAGHDGLHGPLLINASNAEQQGSEMMNALMSISEPAHYDLSAVAGGVRVPGASRQSVLHAITDKFGLDADVALAMHQVRNWQ
jgi:hypothetical protein